MVIFSFANERSLKGFFFKFGCIGFSLFWCVLVFTYVYSRYALCLLLQILLVAAIDIKTRDVPTVSSINWLLSQYCKASLFFQNFYVPGGGGGRLFALPRLFHGQRPALDTSILCTHHNLVDFRVNSELVLGNVNEWFKNNCLSLNTEKTHFIHFRTKNSQPVDTSMCLENNRILNNQNTKFLGLIVDNTLSWKLHIDHLINKLSTACCVIRSVKPYVNTNVHKCTIFFSMR
jgi:hypothetical protein